MLRPYAGVQPAVLEDVLAALDACRDEFAEGRPRRELVSAVWSISHLGRLWALAPDGMLRRNDLLAADDLRILESFLARFDSEVFELLCDGAPGL